MGVDRSGLPPLGPEPSFVFPEIRKIQLTNGLRVWTVEHRNVPVITWLLLLPVGSAADPPPLAGLAALTGDLLDEGAGDYSTLELHEAMARTGAQFDLEVSADASVLTLTTLVKFVDRALPLMADIAARPRFEPQEFSRVRDLRLNRLTQLRNLPPAVADRLFASTIYPDHHPYGHLPVGIEAALRAIAPEDVTSFHRHAYRPQRATLIAVGDCSHDALAGMAARAFEGWTVDHPPMPDVEVPEPDAARVSRLVIVNRPDAAQSELRVGHVAAARRTADYHALLLLNMVLGGQFISRLNMKLREERGLTYGASSFFDFRRGRGPFVVRLSVQSEGTVEAVREILAEVDAIRHDRPASVEEVALARAGLTRGYPRGFETAEQIARAAGQIALHDLPDDYFSQFTQRIGEVDADDVAATARRHLHPSRLTTVIVGDREALDPALDSLALGPVHEVAPV